MHPQFPLERLCTHRTERFQLAFARKAVELLPSAPDRAFDARGDGLVIRGETEDAFHRPAEVLKRAFGEDVQIGPLQIRYQRGPVVEEPHMGVRVQCLVRDLDRVRADLISREAEILVEERTNLAGTLRATAPLARLIGYRKALSDLTASSAREVIWFSHYAPVIPRTPGPAAA